MSERNRRLLAQLRARFDVLEEKYSPEELAERSVRFRNVRKMISQLERELGDLSAEEKSDAKDQETDQGAAPDSDGSA